MLFSLFMVASRLFGQQGLQQISKHEFFDQNKYGKLHEFSSFFKNQESNGEVFSQFDKYRLRQRKGNHTALLLGGTGVLVGVLSINDAYNGLAAMALGFSSTLLICTITNVTSGLKKLKYRSILMESIENGVVHSHTPIRVSIALNSSGLGIVCNF